MSRYGKSRPRPHSTQLQRRWGSKSSRAPLRHLTAAMAVCQTRCQLGSKGTDGPRHSDGHSRSRRLDPGQSTCAPNSHGPDTTSGTPDTRAHNTPGSEPRCLLQDTRKPYSHGTPHGSELRTIPTPEIAPARLATICALMHASANGRRIPEDALLSTRLSDKPVLASLNG